MSLILAVAMLAQIPDQDMAPQTTPPPTAAEIARLDLGFTWAVEDSIAREPGTKVPAAYRGPIALLGCESYRGRVDATTRLESAVRNDPSALRWLFWARRSKDGEIKSRANGIIRRMTAMPPCKTCHGTGLSVWSSGGECWDCGGVWCLWIYTPWD